MKFERFGSKYVLRLDKGEEIVEVLKQFCIDNGITLGSVSGIGAVNRAKIGLFETQTKEYKSTVLEGAYEITGLTGNISTMNGEVYLHFHINLSDANFNTFGGHLNFAYISATCEIIVDTIDGNVDRRFDEDIGLNIFNI